MRLLIIEDEAKLRTSLAKGLEEQGYAVDVCGDGEEGFFMATEESYDVIILDLNLPKLSGMDVLESLRNKSVSTPVLILTARSSVDDRVKGLNQGADDYLCKPFAFSELLARIQALQRRKADRSNNMAEYGSIRMDLSTREVTINGGAIDLRPKEFSILQYLIEHGDKVVTRTMISEKVWNYTYNVGSNVIDVHIKRLREKICPSGSGTTILTVKGVGYKLGEKT